MIHCLIFVRVNAKFSSCCCSLNLKVPAIEHDFLTDQRTVRVGRIAGVDKKESALAERRLKRRSISKTKDEARRQYIRIAEELDNDSDRTADDSETKKVFLLCIR